MLEVGHGTQNVDGHLIDNAHIDMQTLRCNYDKSTDPNSSYGPVVLQQLKPGTYPATQEFASIASFSGTSLFLSDPLRIREGDRIAFIDDGDHNTMLDETTIDTRYGNLDKRYELTEPLSALDSRVTTSLNNGTLRATFGECLIESVGMDQITLRDSFLAAKQMQAGRLARLTFSSYSTDRVPKLKVVDCTGFSSSQFTTAGLQRLLKLNPGAGKVFWKFEDVTPVGSTLDPMTHGNY